MERGEVLDKNGNVIHEGDYVFTRMRGGTHEGKVSWERRRTDFTVPRFSANSWSFAQVDEIITDEQRAQERDVKHPPKVSKKKKREKVITYAIVTVY